MDSHEEFLKLFLVHQADLRAFIGSMLRRQAARDDVLQETTLVLWREFASHDRSRSFGAWARGIAANKVLQRLAQEGHGPLLLSAEALPAVLATYERMEDPHAVRREALQMCLQELPGKSRVPLTLRYELGLSPAQAAERVRTTMDAVQKALSRIHTKCRHALNAACA